MEDLEKILTHLSNCRPYQGQPQTGVRRTLERIGNICAIIGAITLGFVVLAGIVHKYIHPLTDTGKDIAIVAAIFGDLVMLVFVPVQMSLGFLIARDRKKRKVKTFEEAAREHDRQNAFPLLMHSMEMLEYTKACLRRRSDRIERRVGLLVGKDTAIVALFGLAVASMKGVGDIKELIARLGISALAGVNFSFALGVILFFAVFLIALSLAGRFAVLRNAYASDVLEEALNLKRIEPAPIRPGRRKPVRYVPTASYTRSPIDPIGSLGNRAKPGAAKPRSEFTFPES